MDTTTRQLSSRQGKKTIFQELLFSSSSSSTCVISEGERPKMAVKVQGQEGKKVVSEVIVKKKMEIKNIPSGI